MRQRERRRNWYKERKYEVNVWDSEKSIEEEISVNNKGGSSFFNGVHFSTMRQRERRWNWYKERKYEVNVWDSEKSIEEEINVNNKGGSSFFNGAHFCSCKF